MTTKRTVSGFTLIEVTIVIALFIIILLALMQFFVSYNTRFALDQAQVATASSAGTAMASLAEDVRVADDIVATHTFSGTTYTTGTNVLVLELPSIDSTGTVITTTSDYIAYYLSNGMIYRVIAADAGSARHSGTKELSDSGNSLSFTYSNADPTLASSVVVDIVTSKVNRGETIQTHLTNTLHLRNFITP
jgi:type II secretory pathway component PulJ